MSEGFIAGLFVAFGTGALFAIITAYEGILSTKLGALNTSLLEHFFSGFLALVVLVFLVVGRKIDLGMAKSLAPTLAMVGTLVLIAVTGVAFSIPRTSVALASFVLVFGQLGVAMLIDAFGFLGYEKIPLTPLRILGLVVMAVGIYLVLPRGE